mmetsp:Transcript_13996/g.37580  ORF Transcript_13996/g.37580 Transcript_13996/m.37580 type:complete len:271 (+) Transcript_13996:53-865(+)|eukprot:CAMPEP_0185832208 /NCGR_PEP_ID=MMETSP1353-20130828/1951_1 /TAXON_ID=1077150 /ORGANISM="Erythrolobus australicus, Strain CCMP3124" /LENGTH=270 /DNA_ID=CAMNT_0028530359 /DNA_START=27 /DNA_END=839 /DNA_ORIENTATION=+
MNLEGRSSRGRPRKHARDVQRRTRKLREKGRSADPRSGSQSSQRGRTTGTTSTSESRATDDDEEITVRKDGSNEGEQSSASYSSADSGEDMQRLLDDAHALSQLSSGADPLSRLPAASDDADLSFTPPTADFKLLEMALSTLSMSAILELSPCSPRSASPTRFSEATFAAFRQLCDDEADAFYVEDKSRIAEALEAPASVLRDPGFGASSAASANVRTVAKSESQACADIFISEHEPLDKSSAASTAPALDLQQQPAVDDFDRWLDDIGA